MYFEPDMFKVKVKVKVCHDVISNKNLILLCLAHTMANLKNKVITEHVYLASGYRTRVFSFWLQNTCI